jgi:hypothetical protein
MMDTSATTTTQEPTNRVLVAVQLGWLSVESFGLLRRYARHGKPPSLEKTDASRQFNFTERAPNLYEQLLISLHSLRATAAQVVPDWPPPIPADPLDLLEAVKADKGSLDRYWGEFERWSWEVWNTLQIRNPLIGQAFTCGGDLAATYWYPQGAGADKLAETLRSHRLRYVAERVDDLAENLPDRAAQVIHHGLDRWSIGEMVKGMDADGQKRALERLEAQVKVWRDLLFGLRQAGSYLRARDRRRVAWGALAATAVLVILVGLAAWLAVLLLSAAGRALLASSSGLPVQVTEISSDLVGRLLNWQTLSALLATLSSVVVVLAGFITRLSGWVIAFYQKVGDRLELRQVYKRSIRPW